MRRLDRLVGLGAVVGGAVAVRELIGRSREWDLDDRSVLIAGGSRGLALLLARRFAREGARVSLCARDAAGLDRAKEWLASEGHAVSTFVCDASDEAEVARVLADVEAVQGAVEVLVNNAAIIKVGPIVAMTPADFREVHDSVFWATLVPTLAVLPSMREVGEGRIVNVTSISGRLPSPHLAPYVAAKFAATGFSETLRAEMARDGIKVTTVVPWFLRTGSYFNATFKQPVEAEFTWFTLGESLPFVSVDADRAAARIVKAAKRGEADVAIGWPAWLLQRVHGLSPGLTADAAGWFSRLLPSPREGGAAGSREVRGEVVEARVDSAAFESATAWGRQAADDLNERRGPGPAPELAAHIAD